MSLYDLRKTKDSNLYKNIPAEGGRVTGPLKDSKIIDINKTFVNGEYAGGLDKETVDRAKDSTPNIATKG